jgi:vanillate O-demethylase ferredoxin subunit
MTEHLRVTSHLRVRIEGIKDEAENIRSFLLRDEAGRSLLYFTAGSHILVHLPGGRTRQYSLCNDPRETDRYVIAVLRKADGNGGSLAMHDAVGLGDVVAIGEPRNDFALDESARSHLLIAGGIGVTPLLAMARRLDAIGADYRLHYCARGPAQAAFLDELSREPFASRMTLHFDDGDPSRGLDVRSLLATATEGMHVYCCGPTGLMAAVRTASAHWPAGRVHFEYFADGPASASGEGDGFEIELASTGAVHRVPAGKSILEVLSENGHSLDSSCRQGSCGTCILNLLEGVPDHRDSVLDEDEKMSNKLIAICCSRSKTPRLKLDL